MADDQNSSGGEEIPHRGRIQAQGERTEKSVAWAQTNPPTKTDMLEKCDNLEAKLSPSELEEREQGFAELRRFIDRAAKSGGVSAGTHKSFPARRKAASDIRVDLEVNGGMACMPDLVDNASAEVS